MGCFKEGMPVVFRDTSFSFGPSLDAVITKAVPGAFRPGSRKMIGKLSKKVGGLEWAIRENPGDSVPKLQPLAPPGPQTSPPSPSLPPAPPLVPAPRAPTASLSSLPPSLPGIAEARARLRVLSDPQGVTSRLRVSVSSCVRRAVGWTGSDQSPLLAIASRSPRPSPASSPGAPSVRSAQPARRRLKTILALSRAPASRVFCNSGYAFFPGRSPNPTLPRSGPHSSPSPVSKVPLGSWDPGAGLCAVSARFQPWPPGARDSGSCCYCCCCRRHLLRTRPPTVPGAATLSTQRSCW